MEVYWKVGGVWSRIWRWVWKSVFWKALKCDLCGKSPQLREVSTNEVVKLIRKLLQSLLANSMLSLEKRGRGSVCGKDASGGECRKNYDIKLIGWIICLSKSSHNSRDLPRLTLFCSILRHIKRHPDF